MDVIDDLHVPAALLAEGMSALTSQHMGGQSVWKLRVSRTAWNRMRNFLSSSVPFA
jgi:hypothetical protein